MCPRHIELEIILKYLSGRVHCMECCNTIKAHQKQNSIMDKWNKNIALRSNHNLN